MEAAVPLNSSPAQVIAYLDKAKIAHSGYLRDNDTGNNIDADVQEKIPHAIIDPTYEIVFRFNDQDRLTGCDVMYMGYVGL